MKSHAKKLSFYKDETFWESYLLEINPDEVREAVQEQYIDFHGEKIHLDIYNQGIKPSAPTVIWCPGTSGYSRIYQEFLLRMWKRGYRIIGVDQIGHGKSGGARGHFTMPLLIEVLQAAITFAQQELNVTGKIVVGGSSLGGFTAFYTGEMDPRVAATICHNIKYGMMYTGPIKMADRLRLGLLEFMVKIAPKSRMSVWTYINPQDLLDPDLPEKTKNMFGTFFADPNLSAKYSLLSIHSQFKWAPPVKLEDFKTPCFLLLGSQDPIFPLAFQKRLFDAIGAPKEMGLIEGGAHMIILTQAEKCVSMVDAWLKKILK